ncbi:hypothetical protein F383_38922 [Gossypium arboreum]|uniref:Uncharacterized protein n=1 Tax=Gossypium arboreum TaxID=29729 RepID=A0A0B0ML82_GOSAR|nr:hypothetical protein F383_38922 [Gossypium arboreum]
MWATRVKNSRPC